MESLRLTLLKNATIGINKELALDQTMPRNWVFLSLLVNLELVAIVTTALEKLTKLVKCAMKLWHLGPTGSSSLSMTLLPLLEIEVNRDSIDKMELFRLQKLRLSLEPISKLLKEQS